MAKVTPRTLALRDQVLAVLKSEGGFPLTVRQVAERCGKVFCAQGLACDHEHHDNALRDVFYHDVSPVLRALERQGAVEKIKVDGRAFWRAS